MKVERSERLTRLRHAQTEGKRAQVVLRDHALTERREEVSREAATRAARVEDLRQSEGRVLTGGALADLHQTAEQTLRREVRAQKRVAMAERVLIQARAEVVTAHQEEERMQHLQDVERERLRQEAMRTSWIHADEQILAQRSTQARSGPAGWHPIPGEGDA